MQELKKITLDSREVAKMVEKNHSDLLRDIARYIRYLDKSKIALVDFFIENQYKDKKGENRKHYFITKKGCEFLAHKMTGEKGAIFTATYINKFHEMEQGLKQTLPLENKVRIEDMTFEQTMRTVKGIMNNLKSRLVRERDILNMQISELDKTGLTDNIYTVKAKGKTYTVQDLGD